MAPRRSDLSTHSPRLALPILPSEPKKQSLKMTKTPRCPVSSGRFEGRGALTTGAAEGLECSTAKRLGAARGTAYGAVDWRPKLQPSPRRRMSCLTNGCGLS